jgi:hypothetical protein
LAALAAAEAEYNRLDKIFGDQYRAIGDIVD